MKYHEVISNREHALRFMERYVNDGSPSGFTEIHTTSPATRPFGAHLDVRIGWLSDSAGEMVELGDRSTCAPSLLGLIDADAIPVHPDMVPLWRAAGQTTGVTPIAATPTASARTLHLVREAGYAKLHYDGLIGRVHRRLTGAHARASVSLTRILSDLVMTSPALRGLSVFREPYAAYLRSEAGEVGFVYREQLPVGQEIERAAAIVPMFALFSRDRLNPEDPPLLVQLIRESGRSPAEVVVDDIVRPLVQYFFALVATSGLQPEWHAQNLLVALDRDGRVNGLVIRDLESTDVDLTIRDRLRLPSLDFMPYKHIDSGQYNYAIKHSFMYDFKIGEYVLEPLARILTDWFGVDKHMVRRAAAESAKPFASQLGDDFFPREAFGIKSVVFNRSLPQRPYVTLGRPKYR